MGIASEHKKRMIPRFEADRLVEIGNGEIVLEEAEMGPRAPGAGSRVSWLQPERFVGVGQRLLELTLNVVDTGPILQCGLIIRLDPEGRVEIDKGLVVIPHGAQSDAPVGVVPIGLRVELQSSVEIRHCVIEFGEMIIGDSARGVSEHILRVQADGLIGVR